MELSEFRRGIQKLQLIFAEKFTHAMEKGRPCRKDRRGKADGYGQVRLQQAHDDGHGSLERVAES